MLRNKFKAWSIEKQSWIYFNIDNVPSWADPSEIEQGIEIFVNEEELFTNDIVKGKLQNEIDEYIGRLGFEDGCVVIYTTDWSTPCLYLTIFDYDKLEKLGTVLENPELLNEEY